MSNEEVMSVLANVNEEVMLALAYTNEEVVLTLSMELLSQLIQKM